jgi:hypothetical protein
MKYSLDLPEDLEAPIEKLPLLSPRYFRSLDLSLDASDDRRRQLSKVILDNVRAEHLSPLHDVSVFIGPGVSSATLCSMDQSSHESPTDVEDAECAKHQRITERSIKSDPWETNSRRLPLSRALRPGLLCADRGHRRRPVRRQSLTIMTKSRF